MGELGRLLLFIGLAGIGLTLLGTAAVWSMDEGRRIRRGLRNVLGADPHALLLARGRGKGVGFNFATNRLAVCWDAGGWCLVYLIEELVGAEVIVDGQVLARVHRGEARRALDLLTGADQMVRLRLVFSDPAHPDFDLDLWVAADEARKNAWTAAEAVQEANRWLARTEALFRRPVPRRDPVVASSPPAPPAPDPAIEPAPPLPRALAEPPPWEDADDDFEDDDIT